MKKFLIIILFILIALAGGFYYFSKNNSESNQDVLISNNQVTNEEKKEDKTITITAIGDVLCHNTQYWDAYNSATDDYDFSYVFKNIKKYTEAGDITIGNLETSFAGKERGYSNYPTFNSPDALAYALKDIGIDIITTAGNHCLDMGFSGLSRTIDTLDNAEIEHLGTYKSAEEQSKIFIKEVNGLKIAFLNYTYGTNGIPVPAGKDFCVNLIDKVLIKKQIEQAKNENVDLICACMHWGTEYRLSANEEQKDLADFLFKNGVDVILGNHPHVFEPMEKRTVTLEDGSKKDCFVIYACGNFICDQRAENTRSSIILSLNITKHTDGKVSINSAKYTPIYMYKDPALKLKKFRLLDIKETIANYESGSDTSIGQSMYTYLKNQLSTIKKVVGEEIN